MMKKVQRTESTKNSEKDKSKVFYTKYVNPSFLTTFWRSELKTTIQTEVIL